MFVSDVVNALPLSPSSMCGSGITEIARTVVASASWSIFRPPCVDMSPDDQNLTQDRSIHQLKSWVRDWALEGSMPFLHWRLYDSEMPECIRQAYVASAAYFASSTATKRFALSSIEEQADRIVKDEDCMTSGGLLSHVARVQTLLIYEIIRLFDGDEYQRVLAEPHLASMMRWAEEMRLSAWKSSQFVETYSQSAITDDMSGWQAWILAESIRRTYIICTVVKCMYWAGRGSVVASGATLLFTARAGLWDATSPLSWSQAIAGGNPMFMGTLDSFPEGILRVTQTMPKQEIDLFGQWTTGIMEGVKAIDSW
jgi:hypothetical protein